MNPADTIDGLTPLAVKRPESVAELSAQIRDARSADHAVYPVGGRTQLGYGLSPTKPGIAIDLTGLKSVIDYPARDMTITVQAGITLSELQRILAAENQELPVDVPLPDRATLGGSIAVNASGVRRFGLGTLRDYVIGISLVNDVGEDFKAGGRVVKNVAGYDIMKLATGSLGTLGIISQVTLKVKPKAGANQWLSWTSSESDAPKIMQLLTRTKTRPSALVLNASEGTYRFLAAFEDNPASVAWQVQQLGTELANEFKVTMNSLSADEASRVAVEQRDFPLTETLPITFKANVLPALAWEFVKRTREVGPQQVLFGNGIIHGQLADINALSRLQSAAGECGGNLVLLRCPKEEKTLARVWGRPPEALDLMRGVKKQFDPQGIFNPNRFVGGI